MSESETKVRGFMCSVDWDFERFRPMDGNKVYADLEDLKADHACWAGCGITEVEISFVRIVAPGMHDRKSPSRSSAWIEHPIPNGEAPSSTLGAKANRRET